MFCGARLPERAPSGAFPAAARRVSAPRTSPWCPRPRRGAAPKSPQRRRGPRPTQCRHFARLWWRPQDAARRGGVRGCECARRGGWAARGRAGGWRRWPAWRSGLAPGPLGRGQLSQIAQMGRTARRVGKPTPGEDQPRQASLNLRHCGPRFGLEAQPPPVGRPRAEDEPGRLPPRRRRRRHIGLPAHASVLWQQMVCSSSLFRGAAASSDDVRRGVHSLALALGSVRLV